MADLKPCTVFVINRADEQTLNVTQELWYTNKGILFVSSLKRKYFLPEINRCRWSMFSCGFCRDQCFSCSLSWISSLPELISSPGTPVFFHFNFFLFLIFIIWIFFLNVNFNSFFKNYLCIVFFKIAQKQQDTTLPRVLLTKWVVLVLGTVGKDWLIRPIVSLLFYTKRKNCSDKCQNNSETGTSHSRVSCNKLINLAACAG